MSRQDETDAVGETDIDVYRSLSPDPAEFSSDEEVVAWDAEGWGVGGIA